MGRFHSLHWDCIHYNTMIQQRIRIIVGDAEYEPGTSAPKGWCATNEPPHLHPWTTASPTMSHHISNNEPPHLQQWATKSPTISHHISNNNPLHLQQWATTSPQWATTSPEKLNRWMFNAGGGGAAAKLTQAFIEKIQKKWLLLESLPPSGSSNGKFS